MMRIFNALFVFALSALLAYLLVSGKLTEAAANSDSEAFKTLMTRIDVLVGPVVAGTVVIAAGGVLGFVMMIWPRGRRREQ